ncbi:uncharacterized protein LOC113239946 isoform X2 [Hyposmocoma kahamanoa]|uniref:uncharacterized protein LOC113239946 isoform X2 n=1 Tax=Hyposmocoma kahamanoa TaxID=1477025 RepID=UPI000E6D9A7E|nr:uncharacterized protein LOC113239946 isoform X2 [Hyposmocoma kahamanoa]
MVARHLCWCILCSIWPLVAGKGIMLLYQPLDISNECVFSTSLRYDLSFGMGLSDTISLLFRTIDEIDYQCRVDIVTDQSKGVYLLLVIKYPNSLGVSCEINPNAFAVFKKEHCIRICDQVEYKKYPSKLLKLYMTGRVRFRFVSNSSVNADINAHSYLVTATSARLEGNNSCRANETKCAIEGKIFCFTGGVACDGIENCGLAAWYDERVSECVRKRETLSIAPIIAVIALIFCSLLTVTHVVMKCIPSVAGAFFIYNANEDNRFCLNPVFISPEGAVVENEERKLSIIPERSKTPKKSIVRDMTIKIGDRLRSAAGLIVHHGENKQCSKSNK